METENKGLIDVRDCPCDGCKAKPCGHPARCVKFALWLNKTVDAVEVEKALEWLEGYAFTDSEQVYTNGTVLVPMFRVRQALEDRAYNGLFEV